jgi:hypothetical protein
VEGLDITVARGGGGAAVVLVATIESVTETDTKLAILWIVSMSRGRASSASRCKAFSRPASASAYFSVWGVTFATDLALVLVGVATSPENREVFFALQVLRLRFGSGRGIAAFLPLLEDGMVWVGRHLAGISYEGASCGREVDMVLCLVDWGTTSLEPGCGCWGESNSEPKLNPY